MLLMLAIFFGAMSAVAGVYGFTDFANVTGRIARVLSWSFWSLYRPGPVTGLMTSGERITIGFLAVFMIACSLLVTAIGLEEHDTAVTLFGATAAACLAPNRSCLLLYARQGYRPRRERVWTDS